MLPAEPVSVALCILSQIQLGKSYPSIRSMFYGIKYVHKTNGYSDPTANTLSENMLEAAHRLQRTQSNRKEPLEITHIKALYHKLILNSTSYARPSHLPYLLIRFYRFSSFF